MPVDGGATLLWHDITDLVRDEETLKRNEQRLALAADGANDGWWEWDLRSRQCYFSARWRALVGLTGEGGAGKPEEWLSRVHRADAASLRAELEAFLSGKTAQLSHEHRLRHEDGTYRWFHCRGAAAPGADDRATRIAGSLTAAGRRARVSGPAAEGHRLPRSADRPGQSHGVRRRAGPLPGRVEASIRPAIASRCSISISIASRWSTTASATSSATSC